MILKEEKKDLFELVGKYALVHCISDDVAMGISNAGKRFGIAALFNDKFPEMKNIVMIRKETDGIGTCCLYSKYENNQWIRVFNLITKNMYWNKPTYKTLTNSLTDLRKQCVELDIKCIAMPKIGCGLDGLQWSKVKEILTEEFKHFDIEILVCYL